MIFDCLATPLCHNCSRKVTSITNNLWFYIYCSVYLRNCTLLTDTYFMLNKNSLGPLKKDAAKQSRIKNIVWYLRWPVRTRNDISLWPSGLVRPKTNYIKLRPSALVRTRTDIRLPPIGLD